MSIKRFLVGVSIGISIGLWLQAKNSPKSVTPEGALKKVKDTMADSYHITGSWIHMVPESIERQSINYDVYRGGISTNTDDGTVQYEFLVEKESGAILELNPL